MSNLTLFENNALATSDLFKSLNDVNDNLLSGNSGGGARRISLRGGKFREIVGKEQVNVSKDDNMNVVIVNAAKISRTYYAGTYDPENPAPPACWSADTQTPAPEVPEDQRQAARCMDCKQNVKGSGQGESRACRFAQRIAVALEGDLEKVYQLQLPATSVFGDAKNGKMPMQAYARYLNAHNTPAIAIVTNMYFDDNSDTPKLLFKAVRPLEEAELKKVVELKDSPDTIKAITMTVAQIESKGEEENKPPKKALFDAPKKESAEESVEEPKKVVKKSDPSPKDESSLSDIVDNWDD